jgi:hypothetical protein
MTIDIIFHRFYNIHHTDLQNIAIVCRYISVMYFYQYYIQTLLQIRSEYVNSRTGESIHLFKCEIRFLND